MPENAPRTFDLRVRVTVHDPEALMKYARDRIRKCWGDDPAQTAEQVLGVEELDLGTAVLEALVVSNENPNPADYGIDFDEHSVCETTDRLAG